MVTLTRIYTHGEQLTIVGIGQATQWALKAIEENLLNSNQISLFGISKFPFDLKSDHKLLKSIEKTGRVVVLEEHYLYGSIAESLKMALPAIEHFTVMVPEYDLKHSYGSPAFHLKQSGITPARVAEVVAGLLKK